jgi:hypothetical protein
MIINLLELFINVLIFVNSLEKVNRFKKQVLKF